MSEICLHKNKVGGYTDKDVNTLLTQMELVLERQLYDDSAYRMKGITSNIRNARNEYKSTININKRDVLVAARAAAKRARTDDGPVNPDILNNSDAQYKNDRQNVFRLSAIGVKDGIVEGITKIVGRDITKPILQTTEKSDFKSVDQYQIHQLFTAITEGAERPNSTNIWR